MSTTSLVRTTAHLGVNRNLILTRSVLSGIVGMVPVPYIDELLAGAVRAQLIRKLAAIRQVDVDENAVHALSEPAGSRVLGAAGIGALAVGAAQPRWRKMMGRVGTSLLVIRRVDEAVESFQIATLFDHYCARMHVGPGLDGHSGVLVRHAIELASKSARSDLLRGAFSRGFGRLSSLGRRLPKIAWSRLRGANVTAAAEPLANEAAELIDKEVGAVEESYLSSLLSRFDLAWASVQAMKPPGAKKP